MSQRTRVGRVKTGRISEALTWRFLRARLQPCRLDKTSGSLGNEQRCRNFTPSSRVSARKNRKTAGGWRRPPAASSGGMSDVRSQKQAHAKPARRIERDDEGTFSPVRGARSPLLGRFPIVVQFGKEASQTRECRVGENSTHRAARPGPSLRKERLLRMTILCGADRVSDDTRFFLLKTLR